MPRFSSGSGSRSSSRPKTYSTQTSPSKSVAPYHPPPVPAPYHPTAPTFLQSAKEGFGLGVGVSIARNIVDRAFGAAATAVTATPTAPPINSQSPKIEFNTKLYDQCIENGATEDFCRQIAASNNIKLDLTTK